MPHPRLRAAALVAATAVTAVTACGEMDEARLVDPGTVQVTAEPGQLRVLRYHDDPAAGDDWRTVLAADPAVVEATDRFREAGSRDAEEDEAADVRLLYEGVAAGRTVLVLVNCRSCADGVPGTDPDDTEVLVWDLVVGEAGADTPTLGPSAVRDGSVHTASVGEHVVVVRAPDAERSVGSFDDGVLRLVARHVPDDGAELLVEVFAAVGPGETTLAYGPDEYEVSVG